MRFFESDAAAQAHAEMAGAQIHGQTIKVGWGKVNTYLAYNSERTHRHEKR